MEDMGVERLPFADVLDGRWDDGDPKYREDGDDDGVEEADASLPTRRGGDA